MAFAGKLINSGLNIIYPPACPICGELLNGKSSGACNICDRKLNIVREPRCLKCGKEVDSDEQELCADCAANKRSFIRGYPAIIYDDNIRKCMMDFKYKGKKGYANYLASLIVRNQGRQILEAAPDVLVPIPVHKKRYKKRGYNQAEVLSRELSKYLGIPVDSGILIRTVNTLPQKKLNDVEREQNLKKAFISNIKRVKYKSVMLVDDIYTTGATIEACTRVLQEAGIRDIYYTSVCIGKGY